MATREQLLAVARYLAMRSRRHDERASQAGGTPADVIASIDYGQAARLCFVEAEKIPPAGIAVGSDEPGSPTRE
jgi:hypothetical protein